MIERPGRLLHCDRCGEPIIDAYYVIEGDLCCCLCVDGMIDPFDECEYEFHAGKEAEE